MNVNYDRIKAQIRKTAQMTAQKTEELAERFKDEAKSLIDSVGRMGIEMMKTEYESFEEMDAPQEAQQDDRTQEMWLSKYGESNEEWIMYLEKRMINLLLGALADMLAALDGHDDALFNQAERHLRVGVEDCMKKREALRRRLIEAFGPNALSLAGVTHIPPNLKRESKYELLYDQMKQLTLCQPGQQTADCLKVRKKHLAEAMGKLPEGWRADLLQRYPGLKLLDNKED